MENRDLPLVKPKLNIFQILRKRIILKKISPEKYNQSKFPEYLKNDFDILSKLLKVYGNDSISKEQLKMLMEYSPELFLTLGNSYLIDKDKIIRENPEALSRIYDKLPNQFKKIILAEYPVYIKQLDESEAVSYILGGMNSYLYADSIFGNFNENEEMFKLIKFLPEQVQTKILSEEIRFIDKVREKSNEEVKKPSFFVDKLEHFSSNSVIDAIKILKEREKKGEKSNIQLFKNMVIEKLSTETQLQLLELDDVFLDRASPETLITYIGDNPVLFLSKLDEKQQINVLRKRPEFFKILSREQKVKYLDIIECYDDGACFEKNLSDEEKAFLLRNNNSVIDKDGVKKSILRRGRNVGSYYYAKYTDIIRNNDVLSDLGQFEPDILSTWGLGKDEYTSAKKINHVIELYKTKTENPEIIKALELLKTNLQTIGRVAEKNSITSNLPKVLLNEKVMNNASPELIISFMQNVNMESLKPIIIETYGEHVKKIFEDRPNLSVNQIKNLDIFDKKVIERFGIGTVHNLLTYESFAPAIVGELARNPEKMKEYDLFSEVVGDYFEDTPLGFENKLVSFYKIKELFSGVELEDFTQERRKNLIAAINDINNFDNIENSNETAMVQLNSLDDLDSYIANRNKIFDDCLEKLEEHEEIKDIIFKRFFGIPYGKDVSSEYKQSDLTIRDMIYYYNLETFISDERTIKSGEFSQEEIDQLELITIIDKIEDTKTLKDLYRVFKEREDEILKPSDFNSIRSKIPERYSKELVDSLLTIEDAKKRALTGEEGISYIKSEEGQEIIKLHGADFRILLHTTGLNNSGLEISWRDEPDEIWKYFEKGCSTISGCVIEPEMLYSCNSNHSINLGFSNVPKKQIIGMAHHDAHVSHREGVLDPEFNYMSVKFNYPDELIRKTAAQITGQETKDVTHKYNEIAMYRRYVDSTKIENETFGGRIMPDYIVVYGEIDSKTKEMSKKFSNTDKPLPIIQIDVKSYPDRTYVRGYTRENHSKKRENRKFVEEIKNITDYEEKE